MLNQGQTCYTISSRNETCERCSVFAPDTEATCPKCGATMSLLVKPNQIPQPPAPTPNTGSWKPVLLLCLLVGAMLVGALTLQDQPQTHTTSVAAQPTPDRTPLEPPHWTYSTSTDTLTSKPIADARLESVNFVNFEFPYSGQQRATLELRKHPRWGKDVILSVQQGQFLCSSECEVSIRYDKEDPWKYTAVEPADHSTTAIFIQGYGDIVTSIKRAKRVFIEARFYQQGSPIFEFDVTNLNW
jgi:hypothetical protein